MVVVDEVTENGSGIESWLATVAETLGPDRVARPDPDRTNVGGYRTRSVPAVIRPRTVEDVRTLVALAAEPGTPSLAPVSTGFNWGLGSREPADDGAVLVELADLSRVRDVDVDRGWVVVEPGVTQGRLGELTAGTARMVNVTASSASTSVLGNALDRGVGLRHQRVHDVLGLEVVLPDGEIARLGWWPDPPHDPAIYPHGLGPDLLPAFLQSSYGIVTAAVIRLLPRPEARRVLRFAFPRDALATGIDLLRRWKVHGLVSGVVKVYDATSSASYGGRVPGYLAHVSVEGTRRSVDAGVALLEEEALESGLLEPVRDDSTDVVSETVRRAFAGDPSNNDAMLAATIGVDAPEEVDRAGVGWLFFLPLVPFDGAAVATAQRLLDDVGAATGVAPGATVNALDADVVDLVVSLRYAPEQRDQAHDALERVQELFGAQGYLPYRVDVDHTSWIDRRGPDRSVRALQRGLKTFLDPNHVIAPGRYA